MKKQEALAKMGKRIRYYRTLEELSQEELAKKVGYTSRAMICKIESGKSDISQLMLIKFANALNVSPYDIMFASEDENEEEQGTPYCGINLSDDEKMFIDAYRKAGQSARFTAYAELLKGIKKNDN